MPAPLRDDLVAMFKGNTPVSHIITGTAGDGNPIMPRSLDRLGGDVKAWNHGEKTQRLAVGERTLVIVKD